MLHLLGVTVFYPERVTLCGYNIVSSLGQVLVESQVVIVGKCSFFLQETEHPLHISPSSKQPSHQAHPKYTHYA